MKRIMIKRIAYVALVILLAFMVRVVILPRISYALINRQFDSFRQRENREDVVLGINGASQEVIEQTYEVWETVPENIREHFIKSEWILVVNGEELSTLTGQHKNGHVLDGVTFYKRKVVYIGNYIESPIYALMHEMGHYLDYSYGKISDSSEWIDLYKEEAPEHLSPAGAHANEYMTETPSEYFADVFNAAIYDPVGCQLRTPKSYDFVMRLAVRR